MGILHTTMLLAKDTVLRFLAGFLRDSVAKRDHPFLGGTTSSHISLRPFAFRLGWEGLFDALKCFQ